MKHVQTAVSSYRSPLAAQSGSKKLATEATHTAGRKARHYDYNHGQHFICQLLSLKVTNLRKQHTIRHIIPRFFLISLLSIFLPHKVVKIEKSNSIKLITTLNTKPNYTF